MGKLIYLEQHGQATASELADAFMVTRTLISRNTWRLIQDNLIQSAKINKLKNSTQPKLPSAKCPKFSHINSNYFTIFEREFHVALEDGDFFY